MCWRTNWFVWWFPPDPALILSHFLEAVQNKLCLFHPPPTPTHTEGLAAGQERETTLERKLPLPNTFPTSEKTHTNPNAGLLKNIHSGNKTTHRLRPQKPRQSLLSCKSPLKKLGLSDPKHLFPKLRLGGGGGDTPLGSSQQRGRRGWSLFSGEGPLCPHLQLSTWILWLSNALVLSCTPGSVPVGSPPTLLPYAPALRCWCHL